MASDLEGLIKTNGDKPTEKVIRLTLELNTESGALKIVEGPTQSRILFYGMLELARDALFKATMRQDEARRPQIVRGVMGGG